MGEAYHRGENDRKVNMIIKICCHVNSFASFSKVNLFLNNSVIWYNLIVEFILVTEKEDDWSLL